MPRWHEALELKRSFCPLVHKEFMLRPRMVGNDGLYIRNSGFKVVLLLNGYDALSQPQDERQHYQRAKTRKDDNRNNAVGLEDLSA